MVKTVEPMARSPLKFGENLRITVAANQGGRRYMEDRCVIHTERGDGGVLKWTFVGVFDGHGGEHASEHVRRNLLQNITKNKKFDSEEDEDILEAIRQGFLNTHEQMRHVHDEWPFTPSGYPSTAGTTVSVVFIRNGKLYTGHVGDSAIFLGTVENGELRAQPLTIDHKPESAAEQLRIAKAGGEVAVKSGVTRVVWKRPQRGHQFGPLLRNTPVETIPFLSVARSLGDLWSYCEETNTFIVSPDPDLGVHRITGNDFCLVLASDGMTNVMSGEQAVSIVFKEEEYVEINEEMNRNHARCVLRTTLQKWRSLRADNVTVISVIFDIEPITPPDNEVLMKIGRFVNVSLPLADRQDSMLRVSRLENTLLATQRTPVIYTGSKDQNFARCMYRGPGFRTHEEEIIEERRNLASKISENGGISIGNGTLDSRRVVGDEENVEYDEDDDEEDDGPFDPSEEVDLRYGHETKSITLVPSAQRPPRPHAPVPVFSEDDSICESSTSPSTSSVSTSIIIQQNGTPSKTPPVPTVRRVKAEAVRRLRTPKIEERRVTRSASRNGQMFSSPTSPQKTMTTPTKRGAIKIGVNTNLTPDAAFGPTTPRRSTRLMGEVMSTPMMQGIAPLSPMENGAKLTLSRKRGRTDSSSTSSRFTFVATATGVTPVVSSLSLVDDFCTSSENHHHHRPSHQNPSRSAPSTPKKSEKSSKSAWSLSKLDEFNKKEPDSDGIIRVSEVADEEDVESASEDVMREPPSKIRRFYGYMRKFIWGK